MKCSPGAFRKKNWFLIALFLFTCILGSLVSLEVDVDELEKTQGARIEFINYVGPHAVIETTSQIRNIGYSMGIAVKAGTAQTGSRGRYFIIHSVSGPDGSKLDADIMGFGVDVGVDHINNVRLIIQGYLEGAYEYSARDAALLARYITIYNAVYRSNMEYFTSRYKTPVVRNLTADKAGISIRYDEWPGRTLMVIPIMTGTAGSLSAIDTTSLTDQKVVDEMRKDEDKGIGDRKDMVDLKEREAEKAAQSAEVQKEAIKEEEKRIQDEKKQVEEEKKQAAQERQQIEDQKKAAETITDAQKKAEEEKKIAESEKAAAQKEQETAQKEDQVKKDEQALEDKKDEAQKTQELADKKTEEAQQERKDIAQDQQKIIASEEAQAAAVPGILGLAMKDSTSHLGRVVRINPNSGAQIKISALDTVSGRTFNIINGKVIAVAGENRGNGAIRLVEINPTTLEIIRQGNDDIDPNSYLWVNGSDLYAIASVGGKRHLAKFDQSFVKKAQSTLEVHQWAAVTFQGSLILTQKPDGSVLLLNAADLTEKK